MAADSTLAIMESLELLKQKQATPSPLPAPDLEQKLGSPASTEDSSVNMELDQIVKLVKKRDGRGALILLEDLAPKVSRQGVSDLSRLRFYVNKAAAHLALSDFDQARHELDVAHGIDPRHPKVLLNLAQVCFVSKEYDAVLGHVGQMLQDNPADADANAFRLAALAGSGRDGEVEEILAESPNFLQTGQCQFLLAQVRLDQGRYAEAEKHLRRLGDFDDAESPDAMELLARTIALDTQQQLLSLRVPAHLIPPELRRRLQESEEISSKAIAAFEKAGATTGLGVAFANRSVTRILLGNDKEARSDCEQALGRDPSLDQVRANLGRLHMVAGNFREAIDAFRSVRDSDTAAAIHPLLAMAHLKGDQPAAALLEINKCVERGSTAVAVLEIKLMACEACGDNPGVKETLDSISKHSDRYESQRVTARHKARIEELSEAISIVEKLSAEQPTVIENKLLLADWLFRASRFADSARAYESIPVRPGASRESDRCLIALYNSVQLKRALAWAKTARGSGPALECATEIEARLQEQLGQLDEALGLRRLLLDAGIRPEHQRLAIAGIFLRQGKPSEASSAVLEIEAPELLDDIEDLEEAARLSCALNLPSAIEIAYEYLQKAMDDPDGHLLYISAFLKRDREDRFEVSEVAVDCSVTYACGGQSRTITIHRGKTDVGRDRFSADHDLAKAILGKQIEERCNVRPDDNAQEELRITAIESKFVRAFRESLDRFPERFPTHQGIQRFDAADGDFSQLTAMAERRREHSEKILQHYDSQSIPACVAGQLLGHSSRSFFLALSKDMSKVKHSFPGTSDEMTEEAGDLATCSAMLLEASAICTLSALGMLGAALGVLRNPSVTQQTMDSLRSEVIPSLRENRAGVFYSPGPGQIRLIEKTAAEAEIEQREILELVALLSDRSQVVAPAGDFGIGLFENEYCREAWGVEALSTLATAGEFGRLLISGDLALKIQAKQTFGIKSAGSLAILRHMKGNGTISADRYHESVLWLVQHNYAFVAIGKDDVIWLLRRHNWSVVSEVSEFLVASLAGPNCLEIGATKIAVDILHEVWREPIMAQRKALICDAVVRAVVSGRNRITAFQALLRFNASQSPIWTPATGEIEAILRGWLGVARQM